MASIKFNEIVNKGSYYELIITDTWGSEKARCKIDKEDLELVRDCGRWSIDKDGYIVRTQPHLAMHRLIMDAKSNEYVDHRKTGFKNKSDNRKKNLRICTQAQNSCNVDKKSNNTSGHKGVCWDKSRNKWLVKITLNGKQNNLGRFEDFEEACATYRKASKRLHRDFGRVT
jgi:hypothetical protein